MACNEKSKDSGSLEDKAFCFHAVLEGSREATGGKERLHKECFLEAQSKPQSPLNKTVKQ